jgi:hypothetical protein
MRDAANAVKAKEERRAAPAGSGDRPAWGNVNKGGAEARPAWGAVRRERGGSGEPDSQSAMFKRAPMPAIPPPLRSDGKAKSKDDNPNVWTRAGAN